MKRYLFEQIIEDLKKKMVFITGPRQVGKTYLAREVMKTFSRPQYLNYDNIDDQRIIKSMTWTLNADLLIFDEIHKMKGWKNFIKGVYDKKPHDQSILVTGSARLEAFRQSGDSLSGRYLHLRLNPLSVKEIIGEIKSSYNCVDYLNTFGGFPEPFLNATKYDNEKAKQESARWRNQYFSDIIREDILEFSRIHEIQSMKNLLQLLRSRIGTSLSYNSLAGDLQVSVNTIRKYIQILESLYVIFLIRPFHKNIARSVLKEPKIYFYDSAYVQGDAGIILENTCAVSLLKNVQYLRDTRGVDTALHFLKTKEKKEIDFVIARNGQPHQFIEVKLSDRNLSSSLKYFAERFPQVEAIQLVHNLHQNENVKGIKIIKVGEWLSELIV